jgi:hypothetical protein
MEEIKVTDGTDALCSWLESKDCPPEVINWVREGGLRPQEFMELDIGTIVALLKAFKQTMEVAHVMELFRKAKQLKEILTGGLILLLTSNRLIINFRQNCTAHRGR